MKGIVLAGGNGTRLNPITLGTSKQLLPIYNKPMIYYPLSQLILLGIKDILIITTSKDRANYELLLGNGSDLGLNFEYAVQDYPRGLADAFIVGEKFIGNDTVALILGDNLLYGAGLTKNILNNLKLPGANILAYEVSNPEEYGVVEFNLNGEAISIIEKPLKPKSNFAIPGLYIYDNSVIEIAKTIKPSERGEIEITSINQLYLKNKELNVIKLQRGTAWFDTGSFDSLLAANNFVQAIETRQNILIGSIHEVSYREGLISKIELDLFSKKFSKNIYGKFLKNIK